MIFIQFLIWFSSKKITWSSFKGVRMDLLRRMSFFNPPRSFLFPFIGSYFLLLKISSFSRPGLLGPPWGWRRLRWQAARLALGGGQEEYGEIGSFYDLEKLLCPFEVLSFFGKWEWNFVSWIFWANERDMMHRWADGWPEWPWSAVVRRLILIVLIGRGLIELDVMGNKLKVWMTKVTSAQAVCFTPLNMRWNVFLFLPRQEVLNILF